MAEPIAQRTMLEADVCARALSARDPRFDGIFFVGITTTKVYCRPICPTRAAHPSHRRFFESAAAAERAGFRPCLRCRPELAPGRALTGAVSRLAYAAAQRISAGALNGRSVAQLARELAASERHLRRALQREIGVSPVELAQTHRLLLAKRLLTDTTLSVTRVAYASGFQSLRRFNTVFRERYGMSPSDLRRGARPSDGSRGRRTRDVLAAAPAHDFFRLSLAYRPPFAWDVLIGLLRRERLPGVEVVRGRCFGCTVRLDGRSGVVFAEDAAGATMRSNGRRPKAYLNVDVSLSLLPVLMPLITRLHQLFDLDAEPTAVDACLERGGLGRLVEQRRGLRIPGALDGFQVGFRALLRGPARADTPTSDLARRVVCALGEPIDTGIPELTHLAPSAERVADGGSSRLAALGVPWRRAEAVTTYARAVADGLLRLEPGQDLVSTRCALMEIDGVHDRLATTIVMRALRWPDAFPAMDRSLQRAAGARNPDQLRARAERWRPWRSYAALHLWLHSREG